MPVGLPAPRGWQLNRSHGLATCAARGPGGGGGVKACHLLAGKLGPAPRREPRTATGTALEYCMQGLPALGPPLGLSEPGVPACHCHAGGRSTHLPRLGRACLPLPLPCRWPEHAPAAPGVAASCFEDLRGPAPPCFHRELLTEAALQQPAGVHGLEGASCCCAAVQGCATRHCTVARRAPPATPAERQQQSPCHGAHCSASLLAVSEAMASRSSVSRACAHATALGVLTAAGPPCGEACGPEGGGGGASTAMQPRQMHVQRHMPA